MIFEENCWKTEDEYLINNKAFNQYLQLIEYKIEYIICLFTSVTNFINFKINKYIKMTDKTLNSQSLADKFQLRQMQNKNQGGLENQSENFSCKFEDTTHISSHREKFRTELITKYCPSEVVRKNQFIRPLKKSICIKYQSTSKSNKKNKNNEINFNTGYKDIKGMPTIHQLIRQRDKINELYRKAANHCKFSETMKQRKLRYMSTKKSKCQKIINIRNESSIQKEKLKLSRLEFESQVRAEKMRLKNSVSEDRKNLAQSLYNSTIRKQSQAEQIKRQKNLQKQLIKLQNQKEIQRKKKMHQKILATHKMQQQKKKVILENKKRIATQNYSSKVIKEYRKNSKLINKNNKFLPEFYLKMNRFSKQISLYENNSQEYDKFLCQNLYEHSTLR